MARWPLASARPRAEPCSARWPGRLIRQGVQLEAAESYEEAYKAYSEVEKLYASTSDQKLRRLVARSLLGSIGMLGKLGREDDAIETYDSLVLGFGNTADGLLVRAAEILKSSKRDDGGGVTVFQLNEADDADIEKVANVMLRSQDMLGPGAGANQAAIDAYDEALRRFSGRTEDRLKRLVAEILLRKGDTLCRFGYNEEGLECYDEILNRFGSTKDQVLLRTLALALHNKGEALSASGRGDRAGRVCSEIIARFSETTDQIIFDVLTQALVDIKTRFA